MTHQIDIFTNIDNAQSPGEYLAAVRAFKKDYPLPKSYEESDWETAVEAEDVEDITYVVDDYLALEREVAKGVAGIPDPDKLNNDIYKFIVYHARVRWLLEYNDNNEGIPPRVIRESARWYPDLALDYIDQFMDPTLWLDTVRFFGYGDNRFLRIENYCSALNIRPRVKPHLPFSQWYEEALHYPFPDEPPDVLEKYYRKKHEECLSRVEELLVESRVVGEYLLQTTFKQELCPGIKPQVEVRGRTGALLTLQLASQVSQVEHADGYELLPSSNEVRPGRIPDKLIQKRKEIVRKLMFTPVDFQNPEKVRAVFKRLDADQIPLPKWNGSLRNWQPKTWKELLEKLRSPEYRKRIALLKRDLYPQRQG